MTEFWRQFMKREKNITDQIKRGDYLLAILDIKKIAKDSGNPVDVQLGLGLKNGRKLPERKNTYELVLTAMGKRDLVRSIDAIFNTIPQDLPKYISVVKYRIGIPEKAKYFNYEGISAKDIHYYLRYEKKMNMPEVVFFTSQKIKDIMMTKDPQHGYVPKGNSLNTLFMTCLGEYHIINTIGSMTFFDGPDVSEDFKNSINSLESLKDELDIFDSGDGGIKKCARCYVMSYNCSLKRCSKCKKIYYCDRTCQKAHSEIHSRVCSSD